MPAGQLHEHDNSIVVDGQRRAAEANLDTIKTTVRAKYAQELADAGLLRRLYLRVRIWQEIRRKLQKVAPQEGLYSRK